MSEPAAKRAKKTKKRVTLGGDKEPTDHLRNDTSVEALLATAASAKHTAEVRDLVAREKRASRGKGHLDEEKGKRKAALPLAAPLHRQAESRLLGAVGMIGTRGELSEWHESVTEKRAAEQLDFRAASKGDGPLHVETTAQQASEFRPRTELELEMARVLGKSKHNLTNDALYTEAELEVIAAMNLKEAKARCSELQKFRALVSYREAKLRRQAKIKSKQYHRLLKKQKRRQLVKEFEELLARDPEAARERLEQIERMRIAERGELRHRVEGHRFAKDLAKHAQRDDKARALLERHLELGRELRIKQKAVNGEDDEDESDDDGDGWTTVKGRKKGGKEDEEMTQRELLQSVAASLDEEEKRMGGAVDQESLAELRRMKRKREEDAKRRGAGEEVAVETEVKRPKKTVVVVEQQTVKTAKTSEKKRQHAQRPKDDSDKEDRQDDEDEDDDDDVAVTLLQQMNKQRELATAAAKIQQQKGKDEGPRQKAGKTTTKVGKPTTPVDQAAFDPEVYLKMERAQLTHVTGRDDDEEAEGGGDDEEATTAFAEDALADAFRDDDVLAEMDADKQATVERQRPKDVDLTLPGWGSWTGEGVVEKRKRKKRFVVKARKFVRGDVGRRGVLIHEGEKAAPISALQPRSVPFPHSDAADYEAVLAQPLGPAYNTAKTHGNLVVAPIATHAGRIIAPASRQERVAEKINLRRDLVHEEEEGDE